jgi:hypothetical protein
MATGMKETLKVWGSLPLEMEAGKERKNVRGKKREKNHRSSNRTSDDNRQRQDGWEGFGKKEKNVGKKERKKTTADSSRGHGGQQQQQQQGGVQMGFSYGGFFGWFGQMVWSDGFRQQQQ